MEVMTSPSWTAVIVMALIYMAIGWFWYSPMAFGSMMSCPSKQEGKCCSWTLYVGEFILALIMAYVVARFAIDTHSNGVSSGLALGFWAWLGFIGTTMFSKVLWAHKPLKTFCITAGFYLVILLLYGAILSVWHA